LFFKVQQGDIQMKKEHYLKIFMHVFIVLVFAILPIARTVVASELIYFQDWEDGIGGWYSKHGDLDPVILTEDLEAPSPPTVQEINRVDEGGNYFSPLIPLRPGRTYCLAGWINWISGGWPFISILRRKLAYWKRRLFNWFW
jgi:hypothetical protein